MNLVESQLLVKKTLADLVVIDHRLTQVARSLSQRDAACQHLRGIAECVRDDLVQDAIATLIIALEGEAELRKARDRFMVPGRIQP